MAAPKPRCCRGFRDLFAEDLILRQWMIETIRGVYERYGFVPLETPAVEFVDVLGKFLPEAGTPDAGIFSFHNPEAGKDSGPDDPNYWMALRYDLTASLSRVFAQYKDLPRPFRRYQLGNCFRMEKPGPDRFREFVQFDFDTVGVASATADAEACCVICDALEALGFVTGDYIVKVNNRKILRGVLEAVGLSETDVSEEGSTAIAVLRALDKLDRLGPEGVRLLLGPGRKDESGDFTAGAGLDDGQIAKLEGFITAKGANRAETCDNLAALVEGSEAGMEGVEELRLIDEVLTGLDYGADRVEFDPSVVRGMSYYTGPVFEGILLKEVRDEKGRVRQFGSIYGGGRYDTLVERFTGEKVPATGASAGPDRLLEALKLLADEPPTTATSKVLVTVLAKDRMADYFRLVQKLRGEGINAEIYLAGGRIGKQLKYADKLGIPLAVIAGPREFDAGELTIKDLRLGRELSKEIEDREEWRKGQPAQQTVPADDLVTKIRELIALEEG
jgi:histidyl-tRNA synthetase